MFCSFFTMRSKCLAHDAVMRLHKAKNGVKNHNHEQTVNASKRAIFSPIYIYIDSTALDSKGFLWYHMGVKLGCFVAVLHEFDLVPTRSRTRVCSREGFHERKTGRPWPVNKRILPILPSFSPYRL